MSAILQRSNLASPLRGVRFSFPTPAGGDRGDPSCGSHFSSLSPPSFAAKEFLSRNRVPYEWVDIDSDATARARAESLLVEIKKGGDFERIAKRESADSGSREQGGDLGWNRRGVMVPEFEQVAFRLRPGDMGLAESSFGFLFSNPSSRTIRSASVMTSNETTATRSPTKRASRPHAGTAVRPPWRCRKSATASRSDRPTRRGTASSTSPISRRVAATPPSTRRCVTTGAAGSSG